jgi:hypothetical protein
MGKFHRDLVLFLLAALPGYLLVLLLYGLLVPEKLLNANLTSKRTTTGMLARHLEEAKSFGAIDVLVIGSSHAYRGFDPRHFEAAGLRMFNLGSSAQTPTQSKTLLRKYLPVLRPKLVVFEMFPLSFALDGVESSLDLISNGVHSADVLNTVIHQNNVKVYNTLAFYNLVDLFGIEPGSKKIDPLDAYVSGGFVARKLQSNSPVEKPAEKWKLDSFQVKEFKACIDLIRNEGSKILLVYAPVNQSFYRSYSNQAEIAQELAHGYSYLDFNTMIDLNDSLDFYDAHHLNQRGVDQFNKALLPYIVKNIK